MSPLLAVLMLQIGQVDSALAVVDDVIRGHVNILQYDIAVSIPDVGKAITATTTIRYLQSASDGVLRLDFDPRLSVDSVRMGRMLRVRLAPGRDWQRGPDGGVTIRRWGREGETATVAVFYHGSPADGLFIQDNVHGARTAFADNWPNRARHWFPAIDHPSDKASVAFHVEVPAGWRAIANGVLSGVDTLANGRTTWHWSERRAIPVYTMVVGAGRMAVTELGSPAGVPHTLWTFPEDSVFAAAQPFARANLILETLTKAFGPFPYQKLAHVESSTRFGGMENSSAIFYTERGYASREMGEGLVVHETAHQWFGDAVTEYDWHHLWLSEGFATYLTAFFYELIGEHDTFRERLRDNRQRYMESEVVDKPVIDTTEQDLFGLLNANNYPKGGWILHMLRREVGDSTFVRSLREFYETYRDSTALTSDFAAIVERQANRELDWFFRQWLLQPGYPKLGVAWTFDETQRVLTVSVRQVQPPEWGRYRMALPIRLRFADGGQMDVPVPLEGADVSATYTGVSGRPVAVEVDPEGDLLLEVVVSEGTD